jgi:hypothetical protein
MAGAGYKLFQTGDVLTAAQVNTYLNEQTVMVFANAAARTSALTSVLAEGMVSYLQDTNAVEVYNGSAWVGVSGAGDVTEVQAGTGISVASGTGPIPVVTNTMATAVDAKGDLIVGTGADTFSRLAVGGTDGHTLQVDSSTATGLKWAASAGGGKVKQIVSTTYSTAATNTTSSWADTGITLSITPTSASNKVLVWMHMGRGGSNDSNQYSVAQYRFVRNSTTIYSDIYALYTQTAINKFISVDAFYLDSPATTSSTTYKVQFIDSGAGASALAQLSGAQSNFILMEVEV